MQYPLDAHKSSDDEVYDRAFRHTEDRQVLSCYHRMFTCFRTASQAGKTVWFFSAPLSSLSLVGLLYHYESICLLNAKES